MNPSDEEHDALAEEYRRASAEEAGRPGAAIRNAILAEAAAAAHRRAPAANDARYLWRGVAGVAVLGFAVLLWRQVDHRIPGDVPVVASQSAPPESANVELQAPMPAPAPAADRASNEAARTLGKMSAAQDARVDADALLRRYFPQQYQSDAPHSVWLVQDATGEVLSSGELAPGESFAAIRATIERDLGGTLLRPWRIRSLQNARGQTIEFATARTP